MEYATYLNGMAETTGELRRRCLDILRQGYSPEAERLLTCMDEIYSVLVTMDFPTRSPTTCAATPTWCAASSSAPVRI